MTLQPMPNWTPHQVLTSSQAIICQRCRRPSLEAGSVEAFTNRGEGAWSLCNHCVNLFVDFVLVVKEEQPVLDVTYGDWEDVDVSEHHMFCSCIECRIHDMQYEDGFDADDTVKFWKENRDDVWRDERQIA